MQLIAQLIDDRRPNSPRNEWNGHVRFVLPPPAIFTLENGRVKKELWTGKQLYSFSLSPRVRSVTGRVLRPLRVNLCCGGREYKKAEAQNRDKWTPSPEFGTKEPGTMKLCFPVYFLQLFVS